MDTLPFVVDVYKRDLVVEHYAIGYLLHHVRVALHWTGMPVQMHVLSVPQTVGGHRYRTRSVEHVADEIALATRYFLQVREYFFDDDTSRRLASDRSSGPTSRQARRDVVVPNAKANVPYDTLKVLKDNGLRLLLVWVRVRQPEDPEQREEGHPPRHGSAVYRRREGARHQDSRHFILGLPGRRGRRSRRRFASPVTSIPTRFKCRSRLLSGNELFRQAVENGWLSGEALVNDRGAQVSALSYPHLLSTEISRSTEEFYRRFYFRPRKLFAITKEMLADRRVMRRRLREGQEFLQFSPPGDARRLLLSMPHRPHRGLARHRLACRSSLLRSPAVTHDRLGSCRGPGCQRLCGSG